jgi:hypothetical protein
MSPNIVFSFLAAIEERYGGHQYCNYRERWRGEKYADTTSSRPTWAANLHCLQPANVRGPCSIYGQLD